MSEFEIKPPKKIGESSELQPMSADEVLTAIEASRVAERFRLQTAQDGYPAWTPDNATIAEMEHGLSDSPGVDLDKIRQEIDKVRE